MTDGVIRHVTRFAVENCVFFFLFRMFTTIHTDDKHADDDIAIVYDRGFYKTLQFVCDLIANCPLALRHAPPREFALRRTVLSVMRITRDDSNVYPTSIPTVSTPSRGT